MAGKNNESVNITIYNSNLAVVKEVRPIALKNGENTVKIQNVSGYINPSSVIFKSLTDPEGASVIEQNFEYDLLSTDRLLFRYVDREIRVLTREGKEYSGTLQTYDPNQIVLKDKDGGLAMIQRPDNIRDIAFPSTPEGLLTKPTLIWKIFAKKAGNHDVQIAYMTDNVMWRADYTALIAGDDKSLDFNGWVTITNVCGTAFKNAGIKLIAGDVHRIYPSAMVGKSEAQGRVREAMAAPPPAFMEKAFSEYHMYTLQRKTDVFNNEIKQIEFLTCKNVKSRMVYKYRGAMVGWFGGMQPVILADYGTVCNKAVSVFVEFKNSEEFNMGFPLPGGIVRVYKRDDADGDVEFIGEDQIYHTPKDEKVALLIGRVFDVVGERKQTEFKQTGTISIAESFELKIRNHKKEKITVEIEEVLYRWKDWKIAKSSDKWEKKDAQTVVFRVDVEPDKEKVVTYTVEYGGENFLQVFMQGMPR